MITKLPLDSIRVNSGEAGYILYDVVQNKLIVAGSSNNIGKIRRTGDELTSPIYYNNVAVEDDNQYVSGAYVQLQIDKILAKIPLYLQNTGGTMQGPILIASTSTDPKAMVTKGQVGVSMNPDRFIKTSGGTMSEAFQLHSSTGADYGPFNAVPKFLVDDLTSKARDDFKTEFNATYLSKNGGTMTGTLKQNPPSEPYLDEHIMTFGFLKNMVQEYVRNTDWSCSVNLGKDIKQCVQR